MPATWPYIRLLNPITAGVTTITKAWGDALEDAFNAIFMGTKALKRVDVRTDADTVPATGASVGQVRAESLYATTSGAQLVSTTDSVAEADHTLEPTLTWKLRHKSKLKASTDTFCRELDNTSGLARIRTVNARWDETSGKWIPDNAAKVAWGLELAEAGATLRYNDAAANWATWAASSHNRAAGPALTAGDFSLDANWGNTATVEQVYGKDGAWNLKVKANGAGIGADPTITLTYKMGSWGTSPVSIIKFTDSDDAAVAPSTTDVFYATPSPSAASITWTLKGTPTGGKVYFFAGIVIGV